MVEVKTEFELSEEDISFLDSLNLEWEGIIEGNNQWLLMHNYKLPEGYAQEEVTVAFLIPKKYPDAGLDMAYYCPPISRSDGRAIPASTTYQDIGGKKFQRWSRHRQPNLNQWNPEFDSIMTHYELMDSWIKNELKR